MNPQNELERLLPALDALRVEGYELNVMIETMKHQTGLVGFGDDLDNLSPQQLQQSEELARLNETQRALYLTIDMFKRRIRAEQKQFYSQEG